MSDLELSLLLRIFEYEVKEEEAAAKRWRKDLDAMPDENIGSEEHRQLVYEAAHAEGRACAARGAYNRLKNAIEAAQKQRGGK